MCCWITVRFQLPHTPGFGPEELRNDFSQEGASPCRSIKGMDSFVLNKGKKGRNGGDAATGGGKMGLSGRAQIAERAVWARRSVLFCFPLLGCARIPARPPPNRSLFGQSQRCKLIYCLFKGFCSAFGFLSIGPRSAGLHNADLRARAMQNVSTSQLGDYGII